ncbi:MAG: ABC transporter substrate-binding protein [Terrimicrobiaceae bacterium]
MLEASRRLALGVFLIAAAAALLLLSDLGSRIQAENKPSGDQIIRAAVLQHASQSILDQGRDGILAGLAERGWKEGQNLTIKRFNAEGDVTVGQAIAREMVNGGNDLLLTISTPSLQAVANANKAGAVPHVFSLVTSPVAAGVGINSPTDHPAWLAGYGTMQPVAKAFEAARSMNPDLKTVGVVWNAGEANAEAQVKLARKVCADMGLTLSETTVDNSAGVGEAAAALVGRGVDAIWVPGDVTVITAIDSVIAAAKKGRIPVFSVIPPNVKRGALFDLGADYHEVGRLTGLLAGDILNGRDPATVAIENVMPEILTLNLQTAAGLKAKWTIPDSLIQSARLVIDANGGEQSKAAAAPVPNPTGKKWKIGVVLYNESPPSEETLHGMADGWKESPLVEGKDYTVKVRSAQGDMAAISGCLDTAVTEGADIIVPLSTPSLQTAISKIRHKPIVFSLVANPMAAGAGKSYTDHLPNVTGTTVLAPFGDMLDLLEKYYPQYKRLGTLFCPAEANSVDLKDAFAAECKKRGFTLKTVAANSPAELADSAVSLMSRPIDAVAQISDNMTSAGFTAITKAARQSRKPLFSLNSTMVPQGAAVALGRDYHEAGRETIRMLERVIQGEDPGKMPFILPPKVVLAISQPNARAVEMTIPPELLKQADKVVE